MSNDADLSTLNRTYLRRTRTCNRSLKSERSQEYFNNCLVFRVQLYILRQRLLSFIKLKFNQFIRQNRLSNIKRNRRSSNKEKAHIRVKISELVRVDFSKLLKEHPVSVINALKRQARNRKEIIENLRNNNIAANWQSFASCYTKEFLNRREFKAEREFDPKDLLEVLKNCSLFDIELFDHATKIIRHRNKEYAHLSELLITPRTLTYIVSSIQHLEALIPQTNTLSTTSEDE